MFMARTHIIVVKPIRSGRNLKNARQSKINKIRFSHWTVKGASHVRPIAFHVSKEVGRRCSGMYRKRGNDVKILDKSMGVLVERGPLMSYSSCHKKIFSNFFPYSLSIVRNRIVFFKTRHTTSINQSSKFKKKKKNA